MKRWTGCTATLHSLLRNSRRICRRIFTTTASDLFRLPVTFSPLQTPVQHGGSKKSYGPESMPNRSGQLPRRFAAQEP